MGYTLHTHKPEKTMSFELQESSSNSHILASVHPVASKFLNLIVLYLLLGLLYFPIYPQVKVYQEVSIQSS